jgi:predicted RNase H-like HicB family nuclease
MRTVEIKIRLMIGVLEDKETGVYVGHCPALDVYSQGESMEDAMEAIKSASLLYVEHCYRRKLLDDELNRRGFSPISASDAHGNTDAEMISIHERYQHTSSIDVPLYLMAKNGPEAQCA